jgi:hypothetical protein
MTNFEKAIKEAADEREFHNQLINQAKKFLSDPTQTQLGYKERVHITIPGAKKPPTVVYISETMKTKIINDDHYDIWFIVRSRPRLTNDGPLGPVPDNWFNVWEFHEIKKY